MAEFPHCRHVMAHEQDCTPFLGRDVLHLAEAFFLECSITDSKDLINDEYLGFEMSRYCKGKSYIHAGGVPLHWGIQKFFHFITGKIHYLIELFVDLILTHSQYGSIKIDVFP